MNIVPINVHALMREVPLVNLLNYSYTFDITVQNYLIQIPESVIRQYKDSDKKRILIDELFDHYQGNNGIFKSIFNLRIY